MSGEVSKKKNEVEIRGKKYKVVSLSEEDYLRGWMSWQKVWSKFKPKKWR